MTDERRIGQPEIVRVDPTTMNMGNLSLTMAVAGWTVVGGYNKDGSVDFRLHNTYAGIDGRTADELADELGLREEDGSISDGYTVSDDVGLEVGFRGRPDERFSGVVQRLFELSQLK
jgi:hypothetical protein